MSCRVVLAAFVAVACCIVMPSPAVGQGYLQLASAERGPQFFLAGSPPGTKVDVSRVAVLRRRVTLDLTDVTVAEALKAITEQAELEIAYSQAILPANRHVSLHAREISVAAALTEVLFDVGADVSVTSGGQMALIKRVVPPPAKVGSADSTAIMGQVTDKQTGRPIDGATVAVDQTRQGVTTGADGRYRFTGLAPGVYTVRARYVGYTSLVASVTVTEGRTITADFGLERSARLLDEIVSITPGGMQSQVKALPTPVSIVTATDIEQRQPQTIVDVIRQAIPTAVSFDIPSRPDQTGFSVRGASSLAGLGAMKIFVDGVEASTFALSPVDPASIERIEVVRGPQASTLYGANAAGGVVQIFTKRGDPSVTRPQVDAQASVGIVQTPYAGFGGVLRQRYTGSVHGGTGDASYNIGGGYTRVGDWLPNGELSRQFSPTVYAGMRYGRGIVSLDLQGRYIRNLVPGGLNPAILTTGYAPLSRPSYADQDLTNETFGVRFGVTPRSWWRHQLSAGLDRAAFSNIQSQRRLTTPADTLFQVYTSDQRKISIGYNNALTRRLGTSVTGTLTTGVDYYHTDVTEFFTSRAINTFGTIQTTPAGSFSDSRATTTNTGYFAQTEIGWRDAVFLTAGLRGEDNSTFGDDLGTPVLPRVGASVVQQLGRVTVKLRGAYGEAIRTPTPGQSFGSATAFQVNLANPLLGPERQRGWDAGVDLVFGSRATLSLTGYDQTARDLIVFVQVATTPVRTFQFQNIGRVSNRGIEVVGTLSFPQVQLQAQYGYVQSRIQELGPGVSAGASLQVGDAPLGLPAHTAGASLALTPLRGTTVTGGLTYVGSYRQGDALAQLRCFGGTGPCQATPRNYMTTFPAFAKLNFGLTQRITAGLEGFVAVDNLTNNQAIEGGNTVAVMGRITMFGAQFHY